MFGGSAQLAAVEMLDAGATPVLIVAAAAIINARFVAYSAGLALLFPTTSRATRAVMATTLVDQSYLVTSIDATNHDRSEPERVRFYLGASATIGLIWIVAQVLGVIAGAALPNAANLGAAAPISLAGLAAGVVSARASRRALLGSGGRHGRAVLRRGTVRPRGSHRGRDHDRGKGHECRRGGV